MRVTRHDHILFMLEKDLCLNENYILLEIDSCFQTREFGPDNNILM